MAVKRRVIWMSDEDWAKAQEQAAYRKMTVSALLQALVVGGRVIPVAVEESERARLIDQFPRPKSVQAKRDEILRAMQKGK